MSGTALALVLTGSLLHVGWNILVKDARDKLAFIWLALLPPAFIGAVLLIWSIWNSGVGPIGLACVFVSGAVHALYFWLLTTAYTHTDLSFVYPYCRGIGALLATAVGLLLFNENPSLIGYMGIGLALAAPALEALSLRQGKSISGRGWIFTFLTGASIGAYLVIDKIGVSRVAVLPYLGGIIVIPAIVLGPSLLVTGRARRELISARYKPLIATLFMASSYGVVLAAMQIAPVSYIVAARSSGIIASGIAGLLFFHEEVGTARWAAIGMVALGVYCIGIA